MNLFDTDHIPERVRRALVKMNFEKPTPIQEQSILPALEGRDIMACAQTGTGKTAAFAIPLVSQCILQPKTQVLVLAPTRELAAQIRLVFESLCAYSGYVRTSLIVGGASMHKQMHSLKKDPAIIVATPGRLMDHLRRKSINLSGITSVVLDEADRMLDMGFGPQIEEILKSLPEEKQSLLFSATFPPKIKKLGEKLLHKPLVIDVSPKNRAAENVKQDYSKVDAKDKSAFLLEQLSEGAEKTLVFTRTKRGADRLNKYLSKNGVPASCLHGDRSQSQRNHAINQFKQGKTSVMVATDVASRGLDVDQIALVINYDLPDTAEDYIHRIGRTGRGTQLGRALSLVTEDEMSHWKYLQNPDAKLNKFFSRRRPQRKPRFQKERARRRA